MGWVRALEQVRVKKPELLIAHGGLFGTVGWIDPERELVGVLFTPMPLNHAKPTHDKIRARVDELIPVSN